MIVVRKLKSSCHEQNLTNQRVSVRGVSVRIAVSAESGIGVRVSGRAECGVSGVPGRVVAVSREELLSGLLILNLLGSQDDGGQSQQNDQTLNQ